METNFRNNSEYHRAEHNTTNFYTMVSNTISQDKRLGSIEKGLMLDILTNDDSYVFNSTYLFSQSKLSRGLFYDAIDNLQLCGYLKKIKISGGWNWVINEIAVEPQPEEKQKIQDKINNRDTKKKTYNKTKIYPDSLNSTGVNATTGILTNPLNSTGSNVRGVNVNGNNVRGVNVNGNIDTSNPLISNNEISKNSETKVSEVISNKEINNNQVSVFSDLDLKLKNLYLEIDLHYQGKGVNNIDKFSEFIITNYIKVLDNSITDFNSVKTYIKNKIDNDDYYYLDELKKIIYKYIDSELAKRSITNQVEVNNQDKDLDRF